MAYPVDEKKIAVRILARQPVPEEIMAPILWGLEEEGIPSEFGEASSESAEALAKQAEYLQQAIAFFKKETNEQEMNEFKHAGI